MKSTLHFIFLLCKFCGFQVTEHHSTGLLDTNLNRIADNHTFLSLEDCRDFFKFSLKNIIINVYAGNGSSVHEWMFVREFQKWT